jgi:hypothetical protein
VLHFHSNTEFWQQRRRFSFSGRRKSLFEKLPALFEKHFLLPRRIFPFWRRVAPLREKEKMLPGRIKVLPGSIFSFRGSIFSFCASDFSLFVRVCSLRERAAGLRRRTFSLLQQSHQPFLPYPSLLEPTDRLSQRRSSVSRCDTAGVAVPHLRSICVICGYGRLQTTLKSIDPPLVDACSVGAGVRALVFVAVYLKQKPLTRLLRLERCGASAPRVPH